MSAKSDRSVCAHRRSCSLIWNASVELHARCVLDEKRSLMRLPRGFLHGSDVAASDCGAAVAVVGDCCDSFVGHFDGSGQLRRLDVVESSPSSDRVSVLEFVPDSADPVAAAPLALRAFDPFPFFCRVFFGEAALLDWPPGVFFNACLTCIVTSFWIIDLASFFASHWMRSWSCCRLAGSSASISIADSSVAWVCMTSLAFFLSVRESSLSRWCWR
jgi:hypothetical protein